MMKLCVSNVWIIMTMSALQDRAICLGLFLCFAGALNKKTSEGQGIYCSGEYAKAYFKHSVIMVALAWHAATADEMVPRKTIKKGTE